MTYTGPDRRQVERRSERRADRRTLPMAVSGQTARAIIADIAALHGYTADDLLGSSRSGALSRARRQTYLTLHRDKAWNQARIAEQFGRNRSQVCRALVLAERDERTLRAAQGDPHYVLALESQMRRLSGSELALQVARTLAVPIWQAIFLAILMESYPRVRSTTEMCELYDAAVERLHYGRSSSVEAEHLRSFVTRVRKNFAAQGLSSPVVTLSGALVLSDEIAPWLHNRFGKPVSIPDRRTA